MPNRIHRDEITIVMYHHVIDYTNLKYRGIKGLDIDLFERQIVYLKEHYSIMTMGDLQEAIKGKKELGKNAVVLTFDDGYKSQHDYALPILRKYGVKATFYVSGGVTGHKVFNANKVHYILATTGTDVVYNRLIKLIMEYNNLPSIEDYKHRYYHANRFDDEQVIFIKRMLQIGLPKTVRDEICDRLFREYVTDDERSFASQIYLSTENLLEMQNEGMEISMHSAEHEWLNELSYEEQKKMIISNRDYLTSIGIDTTKGGFCYPFGAYNQETLEILESLNISCATTTEVATTTLNEAIKRPLELPRLDCNDITDMM